AFRRLNDKRIPRRRHALAPGFSFEARVDDILIRDGILLYGSGRAGKSGDLLIKDGCIAAIGPRLAQPAQKIIDAAGLAVTPGFIDIKTHSDFTLPINPKAESKVRQGVTTE